VVLIELDAVAFGSVRRASVAPVFPSNFALLLHTQPGLGQGNTFVTSWDDMRKK